MAKRARVGWRRGCGGKNKGGDSGNTACSCLFICCRPWELRPAQVNLTDYHRDLLVPNLSINQLAETMSRGGRGGRGRGGFGRGRGGFGGGSMPPMGLTFADIQSLSREEDPLYPV